MGGEVPLPCKPDSVPARRRVTVISLPACAGPRLRGVRLIPGSWIGRAALSLFCLAPRGVCRAARVAPVRGGLLPHRFTLACVPRGGTIGGLLSAALSIRSPRGFRPPLSRGALPYGVRTFLDPASEKAGPRPSGERQPQVCPPFHSGDNFKKSAPARIRHARCATTAVSSVSSQFRLESGNASSNIHES